MPITKGGRGVGGPTEKPAKSVLNLHIDEATHREFKAACSRKGCSMVESLKSFMRAEIQSAETVGRHSVCNDTALSFVQE